MFTHVVLTILVVFTLCACNERTPLTRGTASAIAGAYLVEKGLDWGDPLEILPPLDEHINDRGRLYWQLTYRPDRSGSAHVVLVNDLSGWARLPGPDAPIRLAAVSPLGNLEGNDNSTIEPGTWILMVTQSTDPLALEDEVKKLNRLASDTNLLPVFSLRRGKGRNPHQVVYGWFNDHATVKDTRIEDWIRLRTSYRDLQWVDLGDNLGVSVPTPSAAPAPASPPKAAPTPAATGAVL